MKPFLVKSALFGSVIVAAIVSMSFVPKPSYKNADYLGAIIDKHERAASLKSPKIILVGGSNLAFGIDSERIENELGISVANMGLHAGLGLTFMLEEAKTVVEPGDLVVLSPEYFIDLEGDLRLKEEVTAIFPEAGAYCRQFGYQQLSLYLDRQRKTFQGLIRGNKVEPHKQELYQRDGFNSYGDFVKHFNMEKPAEREGAGRIMKREIWAGMGAINEFHLHINAKGAKVIFLYPNFTRSDFEKNSDTIAWLDKLLREKLTVEILCTPSDFVFDDSYFFDTTYHLDADGRKMRTDRMIEIIQSSNLISR